MGALDLASKSINTVMGQEDTTSGRSGSGSLANTFQQAASGMTGGNTQQDAGITPDAPTSMTGGGAAAPSLDDYYMKNPGAAQSEGLDPLVPDQATATGYDATTGAVAEEDTASGRMAKITALDSPNMQRAEQYGLRQAGGRGLLNSSIAAGAAQGAMVDRAIPLAQTDAQLIAQQNIENQQATNRAAEITTGRETDVAVSNVAEANQSARVDQQIAGDMEMSNTRAENDMMNTVLSANANINAQAMADLGAMQRTLIDVDARKYATDSAKGAQIYSSTLAAIGDLYNNPNLSEKAIKTAAEHLMMNARSTLNFSMGMDSLNFGGDGTLQNAAMPDPVVQEPTPAAAPTGLPPRSFGGRL